MMILDRPVIVSSTITDRPKIIILVRCRAKTNCPVEVKYQYKNVIYSATVTNNLSA